jgi:5S rRNA maturation endonuclease (ribonuclease M5)
MTGIRDKIKSLRDTIGVEYKRPPVEKLEKMIDQLQSNEKALEYLHIDRGLSDDTIKYFKLGYDDERDAIAIPIFKKDELINIKYRLLNPIKHKYSSEKGAETWIYHEEGIQKGLDKKNVVVVEGEFDLMSCWQAGIKSVISPASGKDSYGVWIEMLDNIPGVFIAYDNDKPGKGAAMKMAERVGIEKCFEVEYPEGIKDANEFFKSYTKDDFASMVKNAKPFYKYQFKGVGDIINSLRYDKEDSVQSKFIPSVEMGKDWLMAVSGKSNVGKTSYVMNLADDLTRQGVPTLVMPFERGIESVGKRFLQVKFDKSTNEFKQMDENDWDPLIEECLDLPVYFSVPKRDDVVETIIKSKRLFNTQVVIVDHLDYLVRHVSGSRESEISNTLQDLKRIAEENGIIMIIVTHIRKIDNAGASIQRKPSIEDLKGSASLYQDPECVVMLNGNGVDSMEVSVLKNKGKMESRKYEFDATTGRLREEMQF